ncbi:MAG: glutaredoxin family protein [Anaeromicrobium sp.]|jgi:glutaredoxin-like YruB-family protein|uniref:glutaredoxin family protein n=1 Tax=Anaeromicrobium sp. TaxID=1929132 RepID=UPI0025EDC8B1|nr:glutaredoxin family protein [Anaeromicrobium sp.]MCT4595080.1 glutaredoxin family protein [Anaeromicrobium sp.]
MSKTVLVYSSDSCIYCKEAKEYLNSEGVDFEEKNVSKDMNARKELMKMGFMSVPIIKVDDEVIQGFDKEKLEELLK